MPVTARVSIFCPDRTGLVAAVAGRLFDLGANLADTSFAVLGAGAEFNAVCELPDDTRLSEVQGQLAALEETSGGTVSVTPFALEPVHGPKGRTTHRIVVGGGDRPGLIARLGEVFVQFKANIVRLNAARIPTSGEPHYSVAIDVWIPPESIHVCLATVGNTAGEMGLTFRWREARAETD